MHGKGKVLNGVVWLLFGCASEYGLLCEESLV